MTPGMKKAMTATNTLDPTKRDILDAVSPTGGRQARPQPRERTRIYVVAVALIFGQLLVASVLSSYWRAQDLAETLTRGEAETHFHAFHRIASPELPKQRDAQLAALLVAQSSAGLRYVAVLNHAGEPEFAAGEALGPPGEHEHEPESSARVGDRVRSTSVMPMRFGPSGRGGPRPSPPRRREAGAEDPSIELVDRRGGAGPDVRPPRGMLPPPRVLIEFVPVAAPAMIARARVNFSLAVLGEDRKSTRL